VPHTPLSERQSGCRTTPPPAIQKRLKRAFASSNPQGLVRHSRRQRKVETRSGVSRNAPCASSQGHRDALLQNGASRTPPRPSLSASALPPPALSLPGARAAAAAPRAQVQVSRVNRPNHQLLRRANQRLLLKRANQRILKRGGATDTSASGCDAVLAGGGWPRRGTSDTAEGALAGREAGAVLRWVEGRVSSMR
jgi:hypothetical protein